MFCDNANNFGLIGSKSGPNDFSTVVLKMPAPAIISLRLGKVELQVSCVGFSSGVIAQECLHQTQVVHLVD